MKKFVIFLLIILFVCILSVTICYRANAEHQNFNFFNKMAILLSEEDCYIKMSIINNNIYAGLILYGPSVEKEAQLYLFNNQTKELTIIPAWAKNSAELRNELLRIGLTNPNRFIDNQQLNPFTLLDSGIRLIFDFSN